MKRLQVRTRTIVIVLNAYFTSLNINIESVYQQCIKKSFLGMFKRNRMIHCYTEEELKHEVLQRSGKKYNRLKKYELK